MAHCVADAPYEIVHWKSNSVLFGNLKDLKKGTSLGGRGKSSAMATKMKDRLTGWSIETKPQYIRVKNRHRIFNNVNDKLNRYGVAAAAAVKISATARKYAHDHTDTFVILQTHEKVLSTSMKSKCRKKKPVPK